MTTLKKRLGNLTGLAFVAMLFSSTASAINTPALFQTANKPDFLMTLDASGSMNNTNVIFNNVCTCNATPNDCNGDGVAQQRLDVLSHVLIELFNTDGSGTCAGNFNNLTALDDPPFRATLITYGEPSPSATPLAAISLGTSPSPSPQPNYWTSTHKMNLTTYPYCSDGSSTIRLKYRATTNALNAKTVAQTIRPGNFTPISTSLLALDTHPQFLPYLQTNDPAYRCRKKAAVVITDGDDTCAGDGTGSLVGADFAQKYFHMGLAANDLYNRTAGLDAGNNIKTYMVGMQGVGLTSQGVAMLHRAAMEGRTDAEGGGTPLDFCDPTHPGQKAVYPDYNPDSTPTYVNDPACANCDAALGLICPGNAYLISDPNQLLNALRTIVGDLTAGIYTVVPPRITISSSGANSVLVHYFGVQDTNALIPSWTGHLEEYTPNNTNGAYDVLSFNAFTTVAAQDPATTRHHYTLTSPTSGALIDFTESNVGSGAGQMPVSSFFSGTSDPKWNVNGTGGVGDTNDAQDIIRWYRGVNTSSSGGTPLLWSTGLPYSRNDWAQGSMYNATPLQIDVPNDPFNLTTPFYGDFVVANANRQQIDIVPQNSGLIAAIFDRPEDKPPQAGDPAQGTEVWGFVPSHPSIRSKLYQVRDRTLGFNDGWTKKADIFYPNPSGTPAASVADWQTRVYVGQGQGGKGVVSLNVTKTTQTDFSACLSSTCPTGDHWEYFDNDLGYTTAKGIIVKVLADQNGLGYPFGTTIPLLVVPGGTTDDGLVSNPDNGRFVYFLNAITGSLEGKIQVLPLTGNLVGDQLRHPAAGGAQGNVPSGISVLSTTGFDAQGDGTADALWVGTHSGEIYQLFIDGKLSAIKGATPITGVPVWQPRDRNSGPNVFGGNQDGSIGCTATTPGNCEARDAARDRTVIAIIPFLNFSNQVELATLFGNPLGSDDENKPDTTHPRGNVLRVIRPAAPFPNGGYNSELVVAGDPTKFEGGYKLPRSLYYDSVNNRPDRFFDPGSAFVVGGNIFFIDYRPASDPCDMGGTSFFRGIKLAGLAADLGKDAQFDPTSGAILGFLDAPNLNSVVSGTVANYLTITTEGAANMAINYNTGEVFFGYVHDFGGGVKGVKVDTKSMALGWPQRGIIGWTMF